MEDKTQTQVSTTLTVKEIDLFTDAKYIHEIHEGPQTNQFIHYYFLVSTLVLHKVPQPGPGTVTLYLTDDPNEGKTTTLKLGQRNPSTQNFANFEPNQRTGLFEFVSTQSNEDDTKSQFTLNKFFGSDFTVQWRIDLKSKTFLLSPYYINGVNHSLYKEQKIVIPPSAQKEKGYEEK